MNARYPPIAELIPQGGPMRLLERVVAHSEEATRCAVDPAGSALFALRDDRIPVWVAIEYMAQCAAAHGGLVAWTRGAEPQPGLVVGSRRLVFRCDALDRDRPLEVTARHALGGGRQLAFDCAVWDPDRDAALAEGRLNVLVVPDLATRLRTTI